MISEERFAQIVEMAVGHASATVGQAMIAELAAHPEMVHWARTGHSYHQGHDLDSCLFCGETLTEERKASLAAAFNDALTRFIEELEASRRAAGLAKGSLEAALDIQNQLKLMPELKPDLQTAIDLFLAAAPDVIAVMAEVARVYEVRRSAPTLSVKAVLPDAKRMEEICARIRTATEAINAVIESHNQAVTDFGTHQESARISIRKHFGGWT